MNIRRIISEFTGWIFSGLTFLGFILIYAGIGARGKYQPGGESNIYFVAIEIVLLLPFIIYMVKISIRLKKATNEETERIKKLKKTGDKVVVDLDELKIRSNTYKQEISVGSGYQQRNEYVEVNHNVILMKIPYKNEEIKFRVNIDMDPTKLKMHFAIKGKTTLYVDPNNPGNNYLDLTFLEG